MTDKEIRRIRDAILGDYLDEIEQWKADALTYGQGLLRLTSDGNVERVDPKEWMDASLKNKITPHCL